MRAQETGASRRDSSRSIPKPVTKGFRSAAAIRHPGRRGHTQKRVNHLAGSTRSATAVVPNARDGKAIAAVGGLPACFRQQEPQSAMTAKNGAEIHTGQSAGPDLSIESGQYRVRVGNAVSAGGTSLNCTTMRNTSPSPASGKKAAGFAGHIPQYCAFVKGTGI